MAGAGTASASTGRLMIAAARNGNGESSESLRAINPFPENFGSGSPGFLSARINCHIYETYDSINSTCVKFHGFDSGVVYMDRGFSGQLIVAAANVDNLHPAVDIIQWCIRVFEL